MKTTKRQIEILLNSKDQFGIVCEHGQLWKHSKDELLKALRFIFGNSFEIIGMRLVP